MQSSDLVRYTTDPGKLGLADIAALRKLSEDFPYFQVAHMLLTLSSRRHDDGVYQQTLKRTAIAVPNRAHLFDLVRLVENGSERERENENENENERENENENERGRERENERENENENERENENEHERGRERENERGIEEQEPGVERLDEEIARQVVTSFVEKEIVGVQTPQPVQEEPTSFGDWLSFLKKNNGQPYAQLEQDVKDHKSRRREKEDAAKAAETPKPEPERRKKNQAIMDKIIATNPGPIRNKEEKFFTPEIKARESLIENEHLVTETLARIYALQGNTGKAIRAYEILSLKYPQKSAYFAGLIQKLRNNEL